MSRGLRQLDIDRVRAGDALATADAIKALGDALTDLQTVVGGGLPKWMAVAFDATDYTASGGTWTLTSPDLVTYRYARIGRDLLAIQLYLQQTSTGVGVTDQLRVRLPQGLLIHPTAQDTGPLIYSDNGGATAAGVIVADGTVDQTYLQLLRLPLPTNWTASAVNTTLVRGSILLQIAPVAGN